MHEIKCPKCGEVFTVDESGYAAIVGQVRDEEFHRELAQREKQLAAEKEKDLALVRTQAARSQEQSEAQLQRQIEELKAQLLSPSRPSGSWPYRKPWSSRPPIFPPGIRPLLNCGPA